MWADMCVVYTQVCLHAYTHPCTHVCTHAYIHAASGMRSCGRDPCSRSALHGASGDEAGEAAVGGCDGPRRLVAAMALGECGCDAPSPRSSVRTKLIHDSMPCRSSPLACTRRRSAWPAHRPCPFIHDGMAWPTHMPTHMPKHMPAHTSTYMPTHMSAHMPTHTSAHMSTHMPTQRSLHTFPYTGLLPYLYTFPNTRLCLHMSIHMATCLCT